MIQIRRVTIPQLTGENKRLVYVYVPNSYYSNPEKRYPVLYMFDGHNVFFDSHATYGKCWGMKEYMENTDTEIIIAAVDCNHSPDHGRLKEYAPYTFHDSRLGTIQGKGKNYMDWLIHEFKPLIDANYRTLPDRDHTMIAGSSMGGLMSFYGVMAHNDVFGRAACLSPSFHFNMKRIRKLVTESKIYGETHVYVDYGSEEMRRHHDMIGPWARLQALIFEKGIYLQSRIVPRGEHCEASWERQLPVFMHTLLYGMDDSEYEQMPHYNPNSKNKKYEKR